MWLKKSQDFSALEKKKFLRIKHAFLKSLKFFLNRDISNFEISLPNIHICNFEIWENFTKSIIVTLNFVYSMK